MVRRVSVPDRLSPLPGLQVIIVDASEVHERAVPADWRPNPFNVVSYGALAARSLSLAHGQDRVRVAQTPFLGLRLVSSADERRSAAAALTFLSDARLALGRYSHPVDHQAAAASLLFGGHSPVFRGARPNPILRFRNQPSSYRIQVDVLNSFPVILNVPQSMLRRKAGDDGGVRWTPSARQTPKQSTAKYQKMNKELLP